MQGASSQRGHCRHNAGLKGRGGYGARGMSSYVGGYKGSLSDGRRYGGYGSSLTKSNGWGEDNNGLVDFGGHCADPWGGARRDAAGPFFVMLV